MGLNESVSAERVHIGFFGLRNAGKSSLVNAITNQELSLVSDVLGTTTDPVREAMELLPIGPVVIIDTPGLDDEGTLGEARVKKARQVLNTVDIAVLVTDATKSLTDLESELIGLFETKKIPYVIVHNKIDICSSLSAAENEKEIVLPPYVNYLTPKITINVPAATAVPITPATFGPIACIRRKLVGFSFAPTV